MRTSFILFALALPWLATTSACAGTPFARAQAAVKLPPDGSQGGPGAAALPLQMLAQSEWDGAPKQKLMPTCDARPGGKVDAASLDGANKVIGAWNDFQKKKPKPVPKPGGVTVGQLAGIAPDHTRTISSIAITCAAGGASTLQVNGTNHPFDLAWAVAGKGTLKSVASTASIHAISLAEKKIVYAKVNVPSDVKNDSEELIIVTNIANYMPADPDEPLVRETGAASTDPTFETLIFGKGQKEGFYYLVPRSEDLALGRFLMVGRFKVGDPP